MNNIRTSLQRLSSTLFRKITQIEIRWFKNIFITLFAKLYKVDWSECVRQSPQEYRHFNDFFTRELRPESRPIAETLLTSPADGRIATFGTLSEGRFIEAKGHHFTLDALIADPHNAALYQNGAFATIYLSPANYHRLHMPITAQLMASTHIPGKLYSVSIKNTEKIPTLFAENERLVLHFESEAGPFIIILVGAINVSSIETVWAGTITPPYGKLLTYDSYQDKEIILQKGEEFARFNMGSTAIIITPNHNGLLNFTENIYELAPIKLGDPLMDSAQYTLHSQSQEEQ